MEILNEIQGMAITALPAYFFIFILMILLGIVIFFAEMANRESNGWVVLFALVIGFTGFWSAMATDAVPTGEYKPTRYEVILTGPNAIIDATKFKIIEKRGEIYLIEEVVVDND